MKTAALFLSLFLLGLAVRAGVGVRTGISVPLREDEPEYYVPAASLSKGLGYANVQQQSPDGVARPTAYRMPLPSLVMALVFECMGGASIGAARWTSIVVGSLSVPLMYLLARRAVGGGAAVVAAIACAIYPAWAYAGPTILSEPYFVPAMLLALILSVRAAESKDLRPALVAGAAWGLATLTRPHGLLMGLAVAALLLRGGWRRSVVFAAATFLVLTPWVVRNEIQFGHPVLLATEGGETLLGANNPYVLADANLHGMWMSPLHVAEYKNRLSVIHDDVERDRLQRAWGMAFLREHPRDIPRLVAYKLGRWLTPITATRGSVRILVICSYGLLLVLLAAGAAMRTIRPSVSLVQATACSLVLASLTMVYWGGLTRGRLPLEILWLPWGAGAACAIAARALSFWTRSANGAAKHGIWESGEAI
jgi:4-amino-4-deoxy-L-arabinose transferase-like glycosyltransferase